MDDASLVVLEFCKEREFLAKNWREESFLVLVVVCEVFAAAAARTVLAAAAADCANDHFRPTMTKTNQEKEVVMMMMIHP